MRKILSKEANRLPGIPRERVMKIFRRNVVRDRVKLMDLYENGTKSEIDEQTMKMCESIENFSALTIPEVLIPFKDGLNEDKEVIREKVENATGDELIKMKRAYSNAQYLCKVFAEFTEGSDYF